jgi:hypothetical protein
MEIVTAASESMLLVSSKIDSKHAERRGIFEFGFCTAMAVN